MNSGPAGHAGGALRRVAAPTLPADDGGWIGCAPDAPYFITEMGASWAPVGHNEAITWPNIAPLYRRCDPAAVEGHFAELAAHGVNCLRLMLDYNQVPNRHLEHRVGRFNPAMVQLWDDLIALGEKYAIRFIITPFDTYFMARRWARHPYAQHTGGPCVGLDAMFTCEATRAAIINRLLFATRRWGHSHAVFAWDLWNEIDTLYAGGDMAVTHAFVTEVSQALRCEEIRLHGRSHLQTVSAFYPALVSEPALGEIVFSHPGLDFASIHLYEPGTIDAPSCSLEPARATARLMAAAAAQCPPARPLMDSEHGPVHSFIDQRMTLPESFDTACFRRTQWAHLASGGVGGGMRWPYRHPHVLLPAMHKAQSVLSAFLPLIDWQDFVRAPLGERLAVHDFAGLACGCGDTRQAIIALMPDETQGPSASRIEITGLAPGCYSITQINTITAAREQSLVHTRQDGTLVALALCGGQDLAFAITPAPGAC